MSESAKSREPLSWRERGGRLIEIDPRTLALFRMGLAALVLVNVALRWGELGAFFFDDGLHSVATCQEFFDSPWAWSIFYLDTSPQFLHTVFAVTTAAALAMMFGCATRVATFICWAFALSLVHRCPLAVNGGDILMPDFVVLVGLSAAGAVLGSIDSLFRRSPADHQPVRTVATAALLLQVALNVRGGRAGESQRCVALWRCR